MSDRTPLFEAILAGNANLARTLAEEAVQKGADPKDLLDREMIPAMDEVGRRFEACEFFVPELLIAARAMKGALEIVKPLLAETDTKPIGRVAIGTVLGDLHDIGKNLVASMLEGGGFEILDLGVDAQPEVFVEAVRDRNADIVALSALLTTTMPAMAKVIDALTQAGLRDRIKVIIGGAPVTQQFSDKIGADGYSETASGAVGLARRLIGVAA